MQQIISQFTWKYGLTRSEVMAEIEGVFSSILSRWYRLEVMVFFRDDLQLEAVAYNKIGGVIKQRIVDITAIRGLNTLKKHLEKNLAKAALLKQTKQYKYYEKELRWGEITLIDGAKNYHVEIEVIPGEAVTAICPLNRVGLHERNSDTFSVGMKRAFHVRRVDPVFLNGTPRLKVMVDRVSKTLVETLLEEQLEYLAEKTTIRCIKRYVGKKCFVVISRRIPKSAIIAVTRELNERMQVRFVRNL